jgi:hypothetical protein
MFEGCYLNPVLVCLSGSTSRLPSVSIKSIFSGKLMPNFTSIQIINFNSLNPQTWRTYKTSPLQNASSTKRLNT